MGIRLTASIRHEEAAVIATEKDRLIRKVCRRAVKTIVRIKRAIIEPCKEKNGRRSA